MIATIIISMMLKMLQVSYFLSPECTSGSSVTPVKWLIESEQAADVWSGFFSYLRNKTY